MVLSQTLASINNETIAKNFQNIFEIRMSLLSKAGLEEFGFNKAETEKVKCKLALEKLSEQYKLDLKVNVKNELVYDGHDAFVLEITKQKPSWSYKKVAIAAASLGCNSSEARVRYLWKRIGLDTKRSRYNWIKYHIETFDLEIDSLEYKKLDKFLTRNVFLRIPEVKNYGDLLVHKLFHLGERGGLGKLYLHVWLDMKSDCKEGFILLTSTKSAGEPFDYFRAIIAPHYKRNNLKLNAVITDGSRELFGEGNYYSSGLKHLDIKQLVDYKQNSKPMVELDNYFNKLVSLFNEAELFNGEASNVNDLYTFMLVCIWQGGLSRLNESDEQIIPLKKLIEHMVAKKIDYSTIDDEL